MDWERQNFSLSQCLFTENSPQKLVAIEAAPAASASNVSIPKASSGHGKTVDIAVGVTIPVTVIAIIFAAVLYLRRRRKTAATSPKPSKSHENSANGPERTSKELNAKENAIHELGGPDGPRNVQADASRLSSPWVPDKGSFPGDRSQMVDLTGDQAASEPSQSEPLLGPAEMYGSSASPVELHADSISELPCSPITRNVSSAGSSSVHRRSRGFFQSRSSTPGLLPSPASAASPPNPLAGGPPPASSNQPTTSSPPTNEVFSPISPIAEGESSASQAGLISVFRSLSQSGRRSR